LSGENALGVMHAGVEAKMEAIVDCTTDLHGRARLIGLFLNG
jgi:hypothetical protein